MAPLPQSPTKREIPDEKLLLHAGNCLISTALRHIPIFPSNSRPRSPKPARAASFADEFCSAAEKIAAAGEEFLSSFLSIPIECRRFLQVNYRNFGGRSSLSAQGFAAVLPGDSVAGLVVANGLNNFLNIYNTLLVVRLVLTWFPSAPPAVVSPLSTICDPYLNVFRGIIPPLGGLDLSPILAFLVLNAFQSTAAALPAELPPAGETQAQDKWKRRISRTRGKSQN